MASTVKIEISKDLFEMIKELAGKNRKKPEEYISSLVREKYKKS